MTINNRHVKSDTVATVEDVLHGISKDVVTNSIVNFNKRACNFVLHIQVEDFNDFYYLFRIFKISKHLVSPLCRPGDKKLFHNYYTKSWRIGVCGKSTD